MNDIEQIIEEPDGIVLLRFRSFREPTNLPRTSPSRNSFSNFDPDRGIPTKNPQNCRFKSPIAEPVTNDPPSPSSTGIGYRYNVLINSNFTIIGLSIRKIITLLVMLPSATGSKKLIETLEERSKRNVLLTCKRLLTHFPCPLFESTM